jgi:hypothetical protein
MSQPVTLAGGYTTFHDELNEIVKQLQLTTPDAVKAVLLPLMQAQRLSVPSYVNRPAREVLSDLVLRLDPTLTWELIHSPAPSTYYLFVDTSEKPASDPTAESTNVQQLSTPKSVPMTQSPARKP